MTRDQLRASLTDRIALIATLLGECANEPVEGQIAVASVIRNRATNPRWWGRGWKGVCLAKSQFSCWWETNQNSTRVYALAEALLTGQAATGPQSVVSQLSWVASGVMEDVLIDNARGADHYLTSRLLASGNAPGWATSARPVVRVGGHSFFRLEL